MEGAVGPGDSVSLMSKGASSKAYSKASSASSDCIKAKAERAALRAKAQAHALDMEEAQLKARKEKLAMESELAAADAKIKVFMGSESLHRPTPPLKKPKSEISTPDPSTEASETSTEYIVPATTQKIKMAQKAQTSQETNIAYQSTSSHHKQKAQIYIMTKELETQITVMKGVLLMS